MRRVSVNNRVYFVVKGDIWKKIDEETYYTFVGRRYEHTFDSGVTQYFVDITQYTNGSC